MRKNLIVGLTAAVLALLIITATHITGTHARYVTTFTGAGSASLARWRAVFAKNEDIFKIVEDEITFNLLDTMTRDDRETVAEGKVAPGATGCFQLDYDTTGSEVAHKITITLMAADTEEGSARNLLDFIVFYADDVEKTPLGPEVVLFTKEVGPGDEGAEGNVDIDWEWPFDKADDAADVADTLFGGAAGIFDLTITFTAEQLNEYTPPEG